jgi:hypothetical protein
MNCRRLRARVDGTDMVAIIDEIERFLPMLNGMVNEGLIAMGDVEVIRYTHREVQPPAA